MTVDATTNIETQAEREIIQFFVGQPTPDQIIAFRFSPEINARFYALIDAEREGLATDAERKELDNCLYLEHLMRMVKVEAHRRIQQQAS